MATDIAHKNVVSQHASFALHNVFTVFKRMMSQKLSLFDTLVSPILNYLSEIWGMHTASDIEMIHTKFLRSVLGVKKSTNLSVLYGELGRIPFSVTRKINMIKYWTKILQQNNNSLLKQVYLMLKQDSDLNINYNGQNWATQIKTILQRHGFDYVWREQANIIIPFQLIRQRI